MSSNTINTLTQPQALEKLQWRAAVKRYQEGHQFPESTIDFFNQVLNLAPSAYGLQPYEFFLIRDPEIRSQVAEAGGHQTQMDEATLLYVLASRTELTSDDVDRFMTDIVEQRQVDRSNLSGLEQTLSRMVKNSDQDSLATWSAKQLYLSMGFFLATVAMLGVDASPMEGFDKSKVDDILNLKSRGLASQAMIAVGVRSSEDTYQHLKKVRRNLEEIVHQIHSQDDLTQKS